MFNAVFDGILKNAKEIFSWKALRWHLLAVVSTLIIVFSGLDWWFYQHTRTSTLHSIVFFAGISGFFVPVVVPLGLYIYGEIKQDKRLIRIAGSIAQAVLLAYLLSIVYKTFTGRIQPEFITSVGAEDITRTFQFGFLRNGIFWGWPSSHAAVSTALGTACTLLVNSRAVAVVSFVYVAVVCVGAAVGFHWLSDVIAGVIFGFLVAYIVVNRFDKIPT